MPLKRSKKTSKKALEEGSLGRRFRLDDKKEAKEAKAKIKAEEEAKKEESRKHAIVRKYILNLEKKFKEVTPSTHFWVWLDKPGFKKIKSSFTEMQKMVSKNPEKYKGRNLAYFAIQFEYKNHGKETIFGNPDAWLSTSLSIHTIDNDGLLVGKNKAWGCDWRWDTDDFKITKFSFKFLDRIMRIVETKKVQCPSIFGKRLSLVMEQIHEKRFKIDDVLQPLAGL